LQKDGKVGKQDNDSESKANMSTINVETSNVSFDGSVDSLLAEIFGEVAMAA